MTTPPPPQPVTDATAAIRRMPTGGTSYQSPATTHNEHRDGLPGWVRMLNLTSEPWGHWCCQAGAVADPGPCPFHDAGWRKQGAADRDAEAVADSSHARALEDVIETAAEAFCDSSPQGKRWADLDELMRDIYRDGMHALVAAGLLRTGQGAADDDTTRLRAELVGKNGYIEMLRRQRGEAESERDDLQARIDKALACIPDDVPASPGHAHAVLDAIRAALTQVSQPQPAPAPGFGVHDSLSPTSKPDQSAAPAPSHPTPEEP